MSDKTALAIRMKENYEQRTKYKLLRKLPTIIRLDGKAFHTYTKGLVKPFDEGLIEDMAETTKFLCENIMGVKCGYTQSDEISLLLWDADKYETQAWFDYNVQKMVSIASSLATAKFNQLRTIRNNASSIMMNGGHGEVHPFPYLDLGGVIEETLAFFDARVFQLPNSEEVVNYFLWRQRDAEKNSVAMLAQSLYSHKELHKKNGSDMQEMSFQKGHNWNDLHFSKKRGSFVVKSTYVNDRRIETILEEDTPQHGELWYQPETTNGMYPNKKGRLLEFGTSEHGWDDWCDIPIEKVRTKWEAIETPMFGKNRESILNLL